MAGTSNIVALCDAIVTAVNTAYAADPTAFACAFVAERRFAELATLDGLKAGDDPLVLFIPHTDSEDGAAGTGFEGDYEVMSIIYARVGVGDSAEVQCAKLMGLRDEIRHVMRQAPLSVTGLARFPAQFIGSEATPSFGMDSLIEKHTFCAAQVLKFYVALGRNA